VSLPFKESDRDRVLRMAWSLGAIQSEDELSTASMEMVMSFLGGDQAGFNEISLNSAKMITKIFPITPLGEEVQAQLGKVIQEHPVVRRLIQAPSTGPLRMSDLVPGDRFRHTRTYEMIFRPRGLEHQLTIPLRLDAAQQSGTVYVVNRCHTDFTDDDLGRAMALQPMLAALHAAQQARRPTAEQIEVARVREGVTERELQILGYLPSGMTAEAIGRILRISPRTVRKHLENAYSKLQVHDRIQAVEYCRRHQLLG
jgi:DNA-binding CsgD family transcriptional regulator